MTTTFGAKKKWGVRYYEKKTNGTFVVQWSFEKLDFFPITGTPPLTRFFGTRKTRVKGKPRYRRNILVLTPQNGEFVSSKSTFSRIFLSLCIQIDWCFLKKGAFIENNNLL